MNLKSQHTNVCLHQSKGACWLKESIISARDKRVIKISLAGHTTRGECRQLQTTLSLSIVSIFQCSTRVAHPVSFARRMNFARSLHSPKLDYSRSTEFEGTLCRVASNSIHFWRNLEKIILSEKWSVRRKEKQPTQIRRKSTANCTQTENTIGHFGKYHNTLCLSPQILH